MVDSLSKGPEFPSGVFEDVPNRDQVRLSLYRSVVAGGHRGVGIFEPMAGHGKDDPARACFPKLEQAGNGSRAGWLYEDPFALCKPALRAKNLLVGNNADRAVTLLQGGGSALPAGWIADANRCRNRVGRFNDSIVENGGGP